MHAPRRSGTDGGTPHPFSRCPPLKDPICPRPLWDQRPRRVCFDSPMEIVEFGQLTADQRDELEGDELDSFEASRIVLGTVGTA